MEDIHASHVRSDYAGEIWCCWLVLLVGVVGWCCWLVLLVLFLSLSPHLLPHQRYFVQVYRRVSGTTVMLVGQNVFSGNNANGQIATYAVPADQQITVFFRRCCESGFSHFFQVQAGDFVGWRHNGAGETLVV